MSAWTDDDDYTYEDGAGTPLPYQDDDVTAALLHDGPPEWLGTRWRDIPPELQWDAWNGLRQWVDWFVKEYRLTTSDVPACWYLHPDLTAELYAAMCMEYKTWEEGAPNVGPMMMWHPNVASMVSRLKQMTHDAGCTQAGAHKEPVAYSETVGAHELDYDEDDWLKAAGTVRVETTIERPVEGVDYVRARALAPDGELLAESPAVGLRAVPAPSTVVATVGHSSTTPGMAGVAATVTGAPAEVRVLWEHSVDGIRWTSVEDLEE